MYFNYLILKRFLCNMNSNSRTCYLKSASFSKNIFLPDNEVIIIGRNKELGIPDVLLSKQQLECKANYETFQVSVKQIGKNVSGCNGFALMHDKEYTLTHGDRIQLRLGFHDFDIIFDPPPEKPEEDEPKPKKMKFDFSIFNTASSKTSSESSTVANDSNSGKWENVDNKELLIFTSDNCKSESLIAAFDIDGTITKTKSGARFPKDLNDWVLNYNDIPQKLKMLYDENHKIVFFTNQSGVGKDSSKVRDFKIKIENIIKKINLPIQVFIATGKSIYRKPLLGMWNVLREVKNDNIQINIENSFYVGDAAGRAKNWAPKRNKDHSCADRLFALNIGLKFYTPEEYFLKNSPAPYSMPDFDPKSIDVMSYPAVSCDKQNVILMVGSPGSGKSYYCKKELVSKGYVHVSRDSLGSWQKCVKVMEENLSAGKNVVIDNTNPDKESRHRFLDAARKYNVLCRCFLMNTSIKHAKHNNKLRELTDKSHVQVSEIIINSYKKSFQEPEMSEGYFEILKIPFIPEFDNPETEKMYKLYLLES